MGIRDRFSVTIGIAQTFVEPYDETLSAHHVTLDSDGTLMVDGDIRGRTFSANVWNSIQIKRLTDSSIPGSGKA